MKRFIFYLVLLHNTTFVLAQTSIDFSYNLNDFSFITNDGVTSILTNLKDRKVCGDSIAPNLPFFFYRIPIQQNIQDASISVTFNDSILLDHVSIEANPLPLPRNRLKNKQFKKRLATRSVLTPIHNSGIKNQCGGSYLLLKATPFLYNAVTGQLSFIKNIHITFPSIRPEQHVRTTSISDALASTKSSYRFNGNHRNTEDSDTIDYLIITSSSLASAFEQLALWKNRKCLRTEIITLDTIYSRYPQYSNAQAKIKACIMDYASPTRKKWVLLGGDDSVVPAKYCLYQVYILTMTV